MAGVFFDHRRYHLIRVKRKPSDYPSLVPVIPQKVRNRAKPRSIVPPKKPDSKRPGIVIIRKVLVTAVPLILRNGVNLSRPIYPKISVPSLIRQFRRDKKLVKSLRIRSHYTTARRRIRQHVLRENPSYRTVNLSVNNLLHIFRTNFVHQIKMRINQQPVTPVNGGYETVRLYLVFHDKQALLAHCCADCHVAGFTFGVFDAFYSNVADVHEICEKLEVSVFVGFSFHDSFVRGNAHFELDFSVVGVADFVVFENFERVVFHDQGQAVCVLQHEMERWFFRMMKNLMMVI